MWIKLCGMTRQQDVEKAQELGADAIGFIFAPSSRRITPEVAAEISRDISITKVGVFVDENADTIHRAIYTCDLDFLQLHGDESPEFCAGFDIPVIKAFRVKNMETLNALPEYQHTWKVLLDAWVAGQYGGTGVQLDPALLGTADMRRTIIAGGITPENVGNLLDRLSPFGLDISSGIEDAPGLKNHTKMNKLIKTIKEKCTYA